MCAQSDSAVILCSTARLARNLQLLHQRSQLKSSAVYWRPLAVATLSQWLDSVIEEALIQGDIAGEQAPIAQLSAVQESILWEQAIASSLKSHFAAGLFDKSGLANAAQEANRLIIEWNLSLPTDQITEETLQFLQWRQRFQVLCKQSGWLEPVRYINWQIECIEAGAGNLPSEIQLAGFDRLSPHLQRLKKALLVRDVKVQTLVLGHAHAQPASHVALNDQDVECRAAVAWAQQQLRRDPQARIAIVVPDLAALRGKLAALLDETFHPQSVTPAMAEIPRCYDFSLGLPLSNQTIISTALDLLRLGWQQRAILQEDFRRLLHSPYWSASINEADARAKLDAYMRQDLLLSFRSGRLRRYMQKFAGGEYRLGISQLSRDLQMLLNDCHQQPGKQLPSEWVKAIGQILQSTRWPGERSPSSHEYQAMQAFDEVLLTLSRLDDLLGKISASEAIKRLTQLCQARIFQVESEGTPSLQVMGMLEHSAELLDAIWVMGMNDHIWPPAAKPNALIPASLQRQAGTPNSSSQEQIEFAQSIHQRLLHSAGQLIFSSALKDGERQLRSSPMLQGIVASIGEPGLASTLAEQFAQNATQNLQWLDDHQAPAVAQGEHVAGGSGLLKAQAICPAWAFYQYRLNARVLKEPANGLDAMQRGTLVHEVLARFWQQRGSRELLTMSEQMLAACIQQVAEETLLTFNAEKDGAFSDAFLTLEAERLKKLVLAWLLEVEMLRPQGFVVSACEQEQTIDIEGISIKLIIDRIDTLEDGRLLVLDYKTGRQMDFRNWAQPEITEPQLPVYAAFVLAESEIAAVCFARVRIAENAFVGIAADDGLVQGAIVLNDSRGRKIFPEADFPAWPALISHWRNSITQVARALKSGDAAVRFDNEKQLDFCEVLPLLRLPERQLQYERQQSSDVQTQGVTKPV